MYQPRDEKLHKQITNIDRLEFEDSLHDPVYTAIGDLGRWQLKICLLMFLVRLPIGWHSFSSAFFAPTIEYECIEPSGISPCSDKCKNISYDRSVFEKTIISEWNLICDYKYLPKTTQAIYVAGLIVGNGMFGILSDKIGRVPTLEICIIMLCLFSASGSISPWFWLFAVIRFLIGFCVGGITQLSFVMVLEIVGPKHRELMTILQHIPLHIGHLSLCGFAYALRDWRLFHFALSLPIFLFISYYWLVPESPRWCLSHEQYDNAAKILEDAAKSNRMPTEHIRNDIMLSRTRRISYEATRSQIQVTLLDLFRYHYLRIKTLCMCFNLFVCGITYFGVSQYIAHISSNVFISVAITASLAIPGTLLAIPLSKYWGRKRTLIASNILASTSMMILAIVPPTSRLVIILALMCFFWISVAVPNALLYWAELLPTILRTSGMGLGGTCQRFGALMAPLATLTVYLAVWMPPIIFSTVTLISAILGLLLPETKGSVLPESISESERIYIKLFCL